METIQRTSLGPALRLSQAASATSKRISQRRLIFCVFSLVMVVLWGGHVYAESDDALFIDQEGNIRIGGNLDVEGGVKAKKYEGDGSALTVGDEKGGPTVKEALERKLDKSGGKMTGDLTIDSTGAITIPAGTTDQRQTSSQNGALRYNTTTRMVEVFSEGMWFEVETRLYMGGNIRIFQSTGKDQEFTVPPGVTRILVKAWGAGGAGGTKGSWNYGSYGGGGGFSRSVLSVSPGEILTVIVGQGGAVNQVGVGYGGGGAASLKKADNR